MYVKVNESKNVMARTYSIWILKIYFLNFEYLGLFKLVCKDSIVIFDKKKYIIFKIQNYLAKKVDDIQIPMNDMSRFSHNS